MEDNLSDNYLILIVILGLVITLFSLSLIYFGARSPPSNSSFQFPPNTFAHMTITNSTTNCTTEMYSTIVNKTTSAHWIVNWCK